MCPQVNCFVSVLVLYIYKPQEFFIYLRHCILKMHRFKSCVLTCFQNAELFLEKLFAHYVLFHKTFFLCPNKVTIFVPKSSNVMKTFIVQKRTTFFETSVLCYLQTDVLHIVCILAAQTAPHSLLIFPWSQHVPIFRNQVSNKSSLIGIAGSGQIFAGIPLLNVELPDLNQCLLCLFDQIIRKRKIHIHNSCIILRVIFWARIRKNI